MQRAIQIVKLKYIMNLYPTENVGTRKQIFGYILHVIIYQIITYIQLHQNNWQAMSRRLHGNPSIRGSQTNFPVNESIVSMKSSYLHPGYQSYLQTTVSRCFHCNSSGNAALMSVCDCDQQLFHQSCFREWIKLRSLTPGVNITKNNQTSSFKCQRCEYDIKFKQQQKSRVRSCTEVGDYCSTHKGIVFGIILSVILILGCLTYLLLLYLSVAPICECNLQKPVLMIALGVISGILILIMGCCCLDCLRVHETRISTPYSRDGKSHRSSRSKRSNNGRSPRGNNLVVESIQ